MRSVLVVIAPAVLDDDTGLGQRPELFPIEDRLDLVLGQPVLDFFGNKLGAIVTAQVLWSAMVGDGLAHPFEHIGTFQGAVGPQHVALAGVFIQDGQHP